MSPSEWDRCRGWIASALPYSDNSHTLEDLEQMLRDGKLWLYPGHRSAALLEIVEFPRWKALSIVFAGGDLEELKAMLPLLEEVAVKAGCKKIAATGRLGFGRALKCVGFVQTTAVFEKELPWA